MNEPEYRALQPDQIDRALFAGFLRRQPVTLCRRKINGQFCIVEDPFTDDWSEADYAELVRRLKTTSVRGGLVLGAFEGGRLLGFAAVEPELFGSSREYLDLSELHVSEDVRGRGVGSALFQRAKTWARAHGAAKLYLSAHSAVETQGFYLAMGCTEALAYDPVHMEKEPCDCQMECDLYSLDG